MSAGRARKGGGRARRKGAATRGREPRAADLAGSLASAACVVFWLDREGRFVYVNRNFCRCLESSARRLLGQRVWDVAPRFTRDVFRKHWRTACREGASGFEAEFRTRGGRTVVLEACMGRYARAGAEFLCGFGKDVTTGVRTRNELAAERAQLLTIFDSIAAVVDVVDTETHEILFMNRYARDLYGQDGTGQKCYQVFHGYRKPCPFCTNERTKRLKGKPFIWEYYSETLDREFTTTNRMITWTDGRHVKLEISLDVSGRKRAEEALRESEAKFRHIVESTPMGIHMYELREGTRLVFIGANAAADRILGVKNSRFVGKTIEDAFPALAKTEIPLRYRRAASDGVSWACPEVNYSERGIEGTFEVHAFQTSPGRMAALFLDVTERKQREHELLRLASAVRDAGESIVITTPSAVIQYVNPQFERTTGYRAEEVVGQHVRILKSGKHGPEFYRNLWSVLRAGRSWHGHFINRKKDGTLFEEDAVISPVRDAEGTIVSYVSVERDVTREMQLEGQIRHSQKMAAIGHLAHRLTHDFTNVLTVILGNTKLARSRCADTPEVTQCLDEVAKAAGQVTSLLTELLAFARPSKPALVTMALDKAVAGAEELLRKAVPPEMLLILRAGARGAKVRVDPIQMEQVLLHLTQNSVEAMSSGGRVVVETGLAHLSAYDLAYLRTGRSEDQGRGGTYAVVTVTDTGCGMSPETLAHMFEPYFTTKREKKRVGLSLSTAFRIIEMHSGFVTVESVVGEGTTFRIYLPLVSG